jgi:1,4-alpha-glucan branching enzyme
MVTPAEYLCEYPENQECGLGFSSWGRGGAGVVWLGPSNQWIYRHLHRMEERMIGLADRFWHASGLTQRALNQAARELLLAQSSDWAFMMDGRTTVDYAVRRTRRHISRFYRIERDLLSGSLDRDWLAEVERRDAVFPRIDYRIHLSNPSLAALGARRAVQPADRLKVLVLSWEFPPMTVGGLSRHVFDLTRELVRQGAEVHVVTTHVDGYPAYERNQGIHVHRVRTFQAQQLSFMDWVFQLNLAMSDYAENLLAHYGPFDLIHAHDWLVCQAAVTLKQHSGLPLAATIHATEHGRNQGLWSDLHYAIHHKEWQLTYEAARVIVCSRYMEDEVKRLFALPEGKLDTIPNGVDARVLRSAGSRSGIREQFALPEERIVFFVGRLVREKGVHILLESIPAILSACPEAKFVIAGKGPMLEELQERARRLDVAHKVHFAGFIDDLTRNELFRLASVAVFPSLYEPFGIAALEAMAAGAPVIVSGTGGLQEIVEYGRDGFTVLPGDAASLANHVIRMLQEGQAAQDMALRALHKVMAEYHWESIAARTLNLYRSICSRKFSPVRNEIAAAGEGILSHPEYEEECK